jgi:hypothetical protein
MNTNDFVLFVKQWKNLTHKKKLDIFESSYGVEPEYIDEFFSDINNIMFGDYAKKQMSPSEDPMESD